VVAGAAFDLMFQSMGRMELFGGGVAVDFAHRVGPLALAVDGSALWTELAIDPGHDEHASGYFERAGASVRWIAGSLEASDTPLAGELRLDGGVGVQSIGYPGGRLTRPDSWIGAALQIRSHRHPDQFLVHVGFRIGFAPAYETTSVARTICRGECMVLPAVSPMDTSWTIVIGGAWGS
jgi:hypothetical protein